ncbi:MAG: dockerin type I domain-containing protein [Saprospiraceae bacterium]
MYRIIISFTLSIFCSFLFSQNLETCTETWCYDNDGNFIKENRFDPNTIKWPIHFNDKVIKKEAWIHVKYEHHGEVDIVSLEEYRKIKNDPYFCIDGVEMYPSFECEYGYSGKPKFIKAVCSLVGSSREENEIRIGVGSCFKKIITWTVIDWCSYDPSKDSRTDYDDLFLVKDLVNNTSYYTFNSKYGKMDRDGAYHYQQVLKVSDVVQPEILFFETINVDLGDDCVLERLVVGNKAKDGGLCPSENFEWTVTLYNENKKPQNLKHTSLGQDSVQVSLESLAAGIYQILWRVKDGCNNPQEVKQVINVHDTKAPNIYCKGNFSIVVGSPGYPINVWARDFVKSVHDNCTSSSEIIISFAKDSLVAFLDLTCEEHLGEVDIPIYATDSEGNQSYCLVKSRFISDDSECKRKVEISGVLTDQKGNSLGRKSIILSTTTGIKYTVVTNLEGRFTFRKTIPISAKVSFALAGDVLGGVISSRDLLIIQKHVTHHQMITDMYTLAAADINDDGVVNSEDVNLLRGYLLGNVNYLKVLGNRLVNIDSGEMGKNIDVEEDIVRLNVAVVVAGDVWQN